MPEWDKRMRLLQDAAKLMGSKELARRLNVHESLVEDWLRGLGTISDSGLLKLAEVLQRWAHDSKPK